MNLYVTIRRLFLQKIDFELKRIHDVKTIHIRGKGIISTRHQYH